MQRIFITGGSGDLGRYIIKSLRDKKIPWVNYDLSPNPLFPQNDFCGDICNETLLTKAMEGCTIVVHIAALHGIHELKGVKEDMFTQVNVNGTKNVLLAMKHNRINKLVFLSSESVNKPSSLYGKSKIACEMMIDEMCNSNRDFKAVSLRCRSFIPHTNKNVYSSFDEWLEYFAKGGVHISDVSQAVFCAMSYCERKVSAPIIQNHVKVIIDGKYEVRKDVTDEEWDKYINEFIPSCAPRSLLASLRKKPKIKVDMSEYPNVIGYIPSYSIRNGIKESEDLIPRLIVTPKKNKLL